MNISRIFPLRLHRQTKRVSSVLQAELCTTATTKEPKDEKIVIPKRIPRGPTDILRALEATVGRDPTAGHYKYIDDPYLIPMSNIGKRTFALSEESGRKTAQFVLKENPDFFDHRDAQPPIDLFYPPVVYDENSKVESHDLEKLIKNVQVSDAVLVYKLLKQKGDSIDPKTEQDLLELLCFHNEENPLPEELIEERWFTQANKGKEIIRKTWKDGEMAEEIFVSMEKPTAEAYSALIQGMAKYFQVDKAWQLFEEAQQKGIVVNTEAYNSMIKVSSGLKEDYEMRWMFIMDLLAQMQANKLKPNLGTLNSVLYCLSVMGRSARERSLATLAEFKRLGVEPSLASWSYILQTFYKKEGTPLSMIIHKILHQIEGKNHTIRDLKDVKFFVTAMNVCRNFLQDVDVARRVHNILTHGNNYDLIGDSYSESIYYRNFFILLCQSLPFDDFMTAYYNIMVPHIYVPEQGVMIEILKQLELSATPEHLPKLWSDIIISDLAQREPIIDITLNIMLGNEPLPDSDLNAKFAKIAWDIYEKVENQHEKKANRTIFSGDWLGSILIMCVRNNDFEKACKVMEKLENAKDNVVGVPKLEALSLFIDQCIQELAPSRAIACIQYCADCGFPEVNNMAADLHHRMNLDERFVDKLKAIVGDINFAKASNTIRDNRSVE